MKKKRFIFFRQIVLDLKCFRNVTHSIDIGRDYFSLILTTLYQRSNRAVYDKHPKRLLYLERKEHVVKQMRIPFDIDIMKNKYCASVQLDSL